MRTDMLQPDFINRLPLPLLARVRGSWWPVADFDAATGLLRIDVCGLLATFHVGEVPLFRDASGRDHAPDDMYMIGELPPKEAT